MPSPEQPVFKRKIFYLSGFDPRGGRFYYHLYKDNAMKYAALAQEAVEVGHRKRTGAHAMAWRVRNETQGVLADYTFLCWQDIVRGAWIRHPGALLLRAGAMYAAYARHARWGRLARLPRAPLVTFFYPLLAVLLLPPALFLPLRQALSGLGEGGALLALTLAAVGSVLVLRRIKALWLLRFFIFNHEAVIGGSGTLQARLEHFAALITQALHAGEYDEILLVSHSNGSVLAVPLMELVLRHGAVPPAFKLLTLGQCIPLVSCMRTAERFNAQLAGLARYDFYWLDVGFPPDGACYARVNPFSLCGAEPVSPVRLASAQFFKYFEPRRYRQLRRNKYQLHFQYLTCADRLSPLNYFALTAGRAPLREVRA